MVNNQTHNLLERTVAEIDWQALRRPSYTPSPESWQDHTLYFLMLDRFSDGQEKGCRDNEGRPVEAGTTPPFRFRQDAYAADRRQWAAAGDTWRGGTLKGLESKLGYLARLGVTALWISPVFKQPSWDNYAYHGYAIQNFLDVDPHFGTRQDLRDMVDTAHRLGIRVILDVILNHAGDVFGYRAGRCPEFNGQSYEVEGFRDEFGHANQRFGPVDVERHPRAWPNRAVWPAELQEPETFSRKGQINNWDSDPGYLEGDFYGLKDIDHGWHERDMAGARKLDVFHPSAALEVLCEIYKFWIAFADIDGFRIDTVKHMEIGATRHFALAIHEFAQSLGKENFLLVGEITGGRTRAFETMELTGLDAALGVDEIGRKLDEVPKGKCDPAEYFALFRNSAIMGRESHAWFGRHVVTMLDDHDQVWKNGHKARFCADPGNEGHFRFLLPAIALNLLTLGIPCLYYGTEQGFDGWGDNDRFLRECMFGGQFGSLQSAGHHFFNEDHPTYREIARLAAVRHQHLALRRGRQYLREVSISGTEGDFTAPRLISGQLRGIVAWSRLFAGSEVLCAINTDPDNTAIAWVTVDGEAQRARKPLRCLYASAPGIPAELQVVARNGRATRLTVPPAGVVIYG